MDIPNSDSMRAKKFRTTRSIIALILREMSTTHGKTAGGYIWALVEPVAAIAVLSVAFQLVFRTPSLGTNFPFYFATGYLPYVLTMNVMNNTARSIRFSRALLAYPGVTWADAIFARVILATLTDVMVSLVVISCIFIVFDINTIIRPSYLLYSLGLAVLLGIGIGSVNCYMFTSFPAYERIWLAATRPLLLLSGVIFLYDAAPVVAQKFMIWNPFLHVVSMSRRGFYPSYDAPHLSAVYVLIIGLAAWAIGFSLLRRHFKTLLEA